MAYISKYSGEQLDAGIAAVQINQSNIDTINNDIDTINNNINTINNTINNNINTINNNINTINNNINTINSNIDTKLDKQNIIINTIDLIDGESALNTGCLYFVYDEE